MSEPICKKCNRAYALRDGYDPTPFCDACAHSELEKALARIEELEKLLPDAGFITCIYCGFKANRNEHDKLADHIVACEKNPILQGMREACDRLELSESEHALKSLRILELEKELAAAGKDKDRLDWMDATAFTAYRLRDAEDGNLCLHCTVVNEDLPERVGNVGPWIRDAIDAAMSSRQQGSE